MAPVPTGHYKVPSNDSEVKSNACIENHELLDAWDCLPPTGMGITVTGQGWGAKIEVDPYPLDGSFKYGPQPPDLSSQQLNLVPSMDQDSSDLGPSLFAFTYYDKLTICKTSF